jgi:hypothetical protein
VAKKLKPHPQDTLYEAAWLSMRNSADFMRDAGLLLRKGSHAHAMGIVVLAEEEFAKGLVLTGLASGHLGHSMWQKLTMRRHDLKHLATAITVVWHTVFSLLGMEPGTRGARRLVGQDPADVLLWCVDKAVQLMQDADVLQRRLGATDADLRFLGRMQTTRERAFYVDIDANGQVWHPSLLSRDDARRYYKTAQARVDLYAFISSPQELRRWLPPVSSTNELVALTRRGERWLFEENGYRSLLEKLRVPAGGGVPAWVQKTVKTLAQMARDPQFHRAVGVLKQVIARRRRPASQPRVTQ